VPFVQLPNNNAEDQIAELAIKAPECANVPRDGLAECALRLAILNQPDRTNAQFVLTDNWNVVVMTEVLATHKQGIVYATPDFPALRVRTRITADINRVPAPVNPKRLPAPVNPKRLPTPVNPKRLPTPAVTTNRIPVPTVADLPTLAVTTNRLPVADLRTPVPPKVADTHAQFVLTGHKNVEEVLVVLATLPLVFANAILVSLELLAVLLTATWFPLAESLFRLEAFNAQFVLSSNKNVEDLNAELAIEPLGSVNALTGTLVLPAVRNIHMLWPTSAASLLLLTTAFPPRARLQRTSCFRLS